MPPRIADLAKLVYDFQKKKKNNVCILRIVANVVATRSRVCPYMPNSISLSTLYFFNQI